MTGSGISRGGGGGGPGDVFLLLLVAAEDEELDPTLNLRLLCAGMFAMIMTAMRRRMVAITAAAMTPPWTMVGVDVVNKRLEGVCKMVEVWLIGEVVVSVLVKARRVANGDEKTGT